MGELNSYSLSRTFFDWAFENPEKITPTHVAMYFFIIEHCNRLGWKEKFGLPTSMAKEAIGIHSYNTYKKTLDDLVKFGFIKMIEVSKNQYSSNIIALSKFNKAHTKALDKALIKHTSKQSESIIQSIDSIDKQVYNNTNIQESVVNNTPAPILGIDYIKAYNDLPDEFKNMYDEEFYKSWLNINSFISQHCQYLRKWSDQLTIIQFKNIFDRIVKKQIEIKQVQQAFLDLDGNRLAKEKYNSVYHGFNAYLKTIQKSA